MTESLRTLDRLRLRARLPDAEVASGRAKILELVASLEVAGLDARGFDLAAHPIPPYRGSLDAIRLATALLWKEMSRVDLTLATHETALGLAARAYGLPVVGAARI